VGKVHSYVKLRSIVFLVTTVVKKS